MTEAEDEAYQLLKAHLDRSTRSGNTVVLNRNNSADRLEATTDVPAESDLASMLADAKPRDCLAVRLGRLHEEGPEDRPLIACRVCSTTEGIRSCHPLLVSGEVIGSVLVSHPEPLSVEESARIRDTVIQAAPVLANLRNLAMAQVRAATDSLSGLPNARAVGDTLKRMVAQASRMVQPLSAVLLDLDHFKKINDQYGHVQGDAVLAAVGVALASAVRESDFVGRYGGEEFIMLLPDTDGDGAVEAALRVRDAFASITVPGVERTITASFGVASYPEQALDATQLVRSADRALYTAKANGRDRVEVFAGSVHEQKEDASRSAGRPDPA